MFKRAKQREPYQTLQTTYAPILRKSRLEMHVRFPRSKYKMRHVQKLRAIWKTLTCWGSQSRMQLPQEVLFPSSHNFTKGVQWSPWIRRSKPHAFSAYGERGEFIPPPPLRNPPFLLFCFSLPAEGPIFTSSFLWSPTLFIFTSWYLTLKAPNYL